MSAPAASTTRADGASYAVTMTSGSSPPLRAATSGRGDTRVAQWPSRYLHRPGHVRLPAASGRVPKPRPSHTTGTAGRAAPETRMRRDASARARTAGSRTTSWCSSDGSTWSPRPGTRPRPRRSSRSRSCGASRAARSTRTTSCRRGQTTGTRRLEERRRTRLTRFSWRAGGRAATAGAGGSSGSRRRPRRRNRRIRRRSRPSRASSCSLAMHAAVRLLELVAVDVGDDSACGTCRRPGSRRRARCRGRWPPGPARDGRRTRRGG